jgi:hypothetical protein
MFRYLPRAGGALLLSLLIAAPAAAHEPLWGETPTVFGFGILHPEAKFIFMDAGNTRNGGQRMRMFMQEYMLDYAPSTAINVRLMIPYHNNLFQMGMPEGVQSAFVSGIGDITVRAKRRFSARQEEGLNVQQALLYGLKLPTGRNDKRFPDGTRLEPHDQAGTGNVGLLLGYAWDRETIDDTIWASAVWTRDLGGGFRMADMVDLSIAYGRWLVRPNVPDEWGLNLAAGLFGQYHGNDPIGGGRHARNSHRLLGVQITPIITKGRHQFRVGVLFPFVRGGAQDHTDFRYEFRAAYETFF